METHNQSFFSPHYSSPISGQNPGQITKPIRKAQPTVTAIIPAYNEGGRIGDLLATLRQVDTLTDIIVIDDGSEDNTWEEVAKQAAFDTRIRIVQHKENQGKGQAVFSGLEVTRSIYILTLDGDLIGLTPQHVQDLMQPVLAGSADMTLGLFRGGQINTDFGHLVTPWLTGQRCLRAALFQYLSQDAASGYGLETALTVMARQYQLRCERVLLKGVTHPPSEFHRGIWAGIKTRARMYSQIIRAWRKSTTWMEHLSRFGSTK
jgi:polyisoprenyl-phosphate glycosyltransferase